MTQFDYSEITQKVLVIIVGHKLPAPLHIREPLQLWLCFSPIFSGAFSCSFLTFNEMSAAPWPGISFSIIYNSPSATPPSTFAFVSGGAGGGRRGKSRSQRGRGGEEEEEDVKSAIRRTKIKTRCVVEE